MKMKPKGQRFVYIFRYRGQENEKPVYVTTAYSVTQAVKQLIEKYPSKADSIYMYFDNHGFDITRKPYVPKEESDPHQKKQDSYNQMSFKGFADENWPS